MNIDSLVADGKAGTTRNSQLRASMLPAWVIDLKARVPSLLESLHSGSPGCYRLCRDGDVVTPGPGAGLGFSCMAAKVAAQCGIFDDYPEDDRRDWIRRIQSFQLPPASRGHGMFCDRAIERRGSLRYAASNLRHGRFRELFVPNWRNRWAETRQAVSTLLAIGAAPLHPVAGFPTDQKEIWRFLDGLDWCQPWSAGAQAGHLLFFLRHGGCSESVRLRAKETVLSFLSTIESAATGGWYRGTVVNQEIVNGAMKILSGLYWWGESALYPERLAWTAVQEVDTTHDCALTNRMFVLNRLSVQLGRVPEGAAEIARASLCAMPAFSRADGGISANKTGSLPFYYYTKVSRGRPVGDLHGLTLFTWGIALAANLLGEERSLGWRLVAP